MFPIILNQVLIMALLMAIGYFLFKKRLVTPDGARELGTVLVYVVIPSVILRSFLTPSTPEKLKLLGISTLLALLGYAIALGTSRILFTKDPLANFASSFCNAGFIGIPLVQSALGADAVFLMVSTIVFLNIFQWTYGVWLMTKDPSKIHITKILKNPIFIATGFSLVVFVFGWKLPVVAESVINSLAALNTPLAMLVCGAYLAQTDLKRIFLDVRTLKVSLSRLVLIPALLLGAFTLIPVDPILRSAVFIALITPVGTNIVIFSALFKQDTRFSVEAVCHSTILSVVTIPLWIPLFIRLIGS